MRSRKRTQLRVKRAFHRPVHFPEALSPDWAHQKTNKEVSLIISHEQQRVRQQNWESDGSVQSSCVCKACKAMIGCVFDTTCIPWTVFIGFVRICLVEFIVVFFILKNLNHYRTGYNAKQNGKHCLKLSFFWPPWIFCCMFTLYLHLLYRHLVLQQDFVLT